MHIYPTLMQTNTTAPLYFLSPGNPVIAGYRNTFEPFNDFTKHALELDIHSKLIEEQDTVMVQQLILALQHYPQLIHKLLFSLDFSFTQAEGSKLFIAKRIWKQDPDYYLWLHKLMEVPFILFFINDEELRYYAMLGDIIVNDPAMMRQQGVGKVLEIVLTNEHAQLLEERLFNACLSLLIFCHGSGFNPEIYILGILASFKARFTYEDVLCEYAEDVMKGKFRNVVASNE